MWVRSSCVLDWIAIVQMFNERERARSFEIQSNVYMKCWRGCNMKSSIEYFRRTEKHNDSRDNELKWVWRLCVCVWVIWLFRLTHPAMTIWTPFVLTFIVILYTYLYQCERIFFFLYRLSYIYKSLILFNAWKNYEQIRHLTMWSAKWQSKYKFIVCMCMFSCWQFIIY